MNSHPPFVRTCALSILCADDNLLLGEVLIRVFDRAGHRVEHVGDGLTAWERLSRDLAAFDVVVTDHHMPGLNGAELVELLREAGYPGRIIVHSSSLTDEVRETYQRLGVTTFVPKTCKPETLLSALQTGGATA